MLQFHGKAKHLNSTKRADIPPGSARCKTKEKTLENIKSGYEITMLEKMTMILMMLMQELMTTMTMIIKEGVPRVAGGLAWCIKVFHGNDDRPR